MVKFDVGWVKLFEQKTWVFCALAVFSGLLYHLIGLGELPSLRRFDWLADTAFLATLFFSLLAIGSLVHLAANWTANFKRAHGARKAILGRLNSLSENEHRILSYLVQANNQSFNYRADDWDVQGLVGKGLLRIAAGQHSFFAVPFIVPDFVWSNLRKRRHEFSAAAPPQEPPWVKDWMAY